MSAAATTRVLIFRSEAHICALALSSVVEVLRPLPVTPLDGAPAAVRGLSVIRGEPLPVLDLGILLGNDGGRHTRLIVIRAGERRFALSVDSVLGVRELGHSLWSELPPLLRNACPGVDAIAVLDADAIFALEAGALVPNDVWESLEARQG